MPSRWYPSSGPRADAEPTDGLPVLAPGVDRLPSVCCHCGSALLASEIPLGQHRYGAVTCSTCSRQLCWLDAPLRSAQVAPRSHERTRLNRSVRPERRSPSFAYGRLPSCGPTCTASYGHDPVRHETAGRDALAREQAEAAWGIVSTGGLVVDLDTNRIEVEGVELYVTSRERQILLYLARHVGRICPSHEILAAIWGAATAQHGRGGRRDGPRHLLRQRMVTLRARLGSARDLVETIVGTGYRLNAEPIAERETP
jgi:DNA-binding winged helix-turn-helix (wHTH) protein